MSKWYASYRWADAFLQLQTEWAERKTVRRVLKDNEVIRRLSANSSTVEAMEQRGRITSGKGPDPLTTVWHLKKKK